MRAFFRVLAFFACLLGVVAVAQTAHAFSVDNVRFGSHPGKVRMVVDLSETQAFRAYAMENPWRLVIDMPAFQWNVGNIDKAQGVAVNSVRQGELQPGISRIVVDFQHPVAISSAFILPRDAANNKPDRLVIDFSKTDEAGYASQQGRIFGKLQVPGDRLNLSATKPAAPARSAEKNTSQTLPGTITRPGSKPQGLASAPPPPAPKDDRSVEIEQPPLASGDPAPAPAAIAAAPVPPRKPANSAPAPAIASSGKKPLIVIDPGHGGVDPGALGANGVYEKQVTLTIAKALKEALEDTGRYRVLLTREKDTYLKLYKRVEFARKNGADLFVSLHADSIGKSNVRGASVYTLSEKASDEQTALLADRENRADLIAGMDLDTDDEQIATILVDLTMRDTMNQSKFFASKLVGQMDSGNVRMLENPHRYAGFAVLKAPDIPSVLVEMGFMSNPREAEQLTQPEYRRTLARALVKGIDAYFTKLQQMHRT